ncbi:unnamed protein product, partial [Nesidiocoris tenuis]
MSWRNSSSNAKKRWARTRGHYRGRMIRPLNSFARDNIVSRVVLQQHKRKRANYITGLGVASISGLSELNKGPTTSLLEVWPEWSIFYNRVIVSLFDDGNSNLAVSYGTALEEILKTRQRQLLVLRHLLNGSFRSPVRTTAGAAWL